MNTQGMKGMNGWNMSVPSSLRPSNTPTLFNLSWVLEALDKASCYGLYKNQTHGWPRLAGPYFHKAHSLVPYPTLIGVTRFDFGFPPRSPPTPFLQVNIEVPKHTKVSNIGHTSE